MEASSSKRRSMQVIMAELALKAFQAFDSALRSMLQTRLLACCAAGLKGSDPAKGTVVSP